MADIRIPKYFSQKDGDNGGAKGACGETCLKMIDCYLTGREVPISAIIANGDGNPNITSIAGMQKASAWLGFKTEYYYDANYDDIHRWLSDGRLIVAVIKYGLWANKYKQDTSYQSGHFILLTGITDDRGAIRFADPYFWGTRREEGWMNNNKWATKDDFHKAFYHSDGNISRNGAVLVADKKAVPVPPPTDPCATVKQQLSQVTIERDSLKTQLQVANNNLVKAKQLATDITKVVGI